MKSPAVICLTQRDPTPQPEVSGEGQKCLHPKRNPVYAFCPFIGFLTLPVMTQTSNGYETQSSFLLLRSQNLWRCSMEYMVHWAVNPAYRSFMYFPFELNQPSKFLGQGQPPPVSS